MIVCHCLNVTTKDLVGMKSLKEVKEKTGACTDCKACKKLVQEIIKR